MSLIARWIQRKIEISEFIDFRGITAYIDLINDNNF
jgi:hypothetical protein